MVSGSRVGSFRLFGSFGLFGLEFDLNFIMSTSPKRSTTNEGKAPDKGVSKDPNIPKLRTKDAREYYKISFPRKVKSTMFVYEETIFHLGVLKGVIQLFCNIKWENFLNLPAKSYELLTREFLASCG